MDRPKEYEELTRRPIPDETMPSHDTGQASNAAINVRASEDREPFISLLRATERSDDQVE